MKAYLVYGFDNMKMEDIPVPNYGPEDALIKVRAVQLSVTETSLFKGIETLRYGLIKKRIQKEAPLQLFGHEFCGEIIAIGEKVADFNVGDRVFAKPRIPCGNCTYCKRGLMGFCPNHVTIGFDRPGALAEYIALPVNALVKVSENVTDAEAAALQPLATAVGAVGDANIKLGDYVAIIGSGAMGLGTLQLVKHAGAGKVVCLDIDELKLRLAKEFGADEVFFAESENVLQKVKDLNGGLGPDIVFEAAGGSPEQGLAGRKALDQAIDMVRSGGRIVQIGMLERPIDLDLKKLISKGLTHVYSSYGYVNFGYSLDPYQYAERAVATGIVNISKTLTHQLQGLEKVREMIEITVNKQKYKAVNPAQVTLQI